MNQIKLSINSPFEVLPEATERELSIKYPCPTSDLCSPIHFTLPRGKYLIECYGASGGRGNKPETTTFTDPSLKCISQSTVTKYRGNTKCDPGNSGGSGGYISGTILFERSTQLFANIGGRGTYLQNEIPKGGSNGGGSANNFVGGCGSGGGATDIRVEADDVFHRIIVAGGGGGSDNFYIGSDNADEGAGGAGGYPNGQGFWIGGDYQNSPIAAQLHGFTFGQGESTGKKTAHPNTTSLETTYDTGGAGGGWFGGFVSGSENGGAGGGSSFVLTKDAQIPKGAIARHNDHYGFIEAKEYAFTDKSKYLFSNVSSADGIWSGNGMIRITLIDPLTTKMKKQIRLHLNLIFLSFNIQILTR